MIMKAQEKILGRYSRPWEGIADTELVIYNNSLVKRNALIVWQGYRAKQYWFECRIRSGFEAELAKYCVDIYNSSVSWWQFHSSSEIRDYRKLYNEIFT